MGKENKNKNEQCQLKKLGINYFDSKNIKYQIPPRDWNLPCLAKKPLIKIKPM